MGPLMQHAIDLHKYMNTISKFISTKEQNPPDSYLDIPKLGKVGPKRRNNNLNFIPQEFK